MRVFIDGEAGTTGLTLRERLGAKAGVELLHLDESARKSLSARLDMHGKADFSILCLPDDAAREVVTALGGQAPRMLDASTAHRTEPGWAYGFPELSQAHRAAVVSGARVAVPGCYASGFAALCYPLSSRGLMHKNAVLCCHAVSGYTGGGRRMIEAYEAEPRAGALSAPRAYALGQTHKHLKEMRFVSGLDQTPYLFPSVADFPRGMLVSLPLPPGVIKEGTTARALRELYQAHYEGARTVRVMGERDTPPDGYLPANALAGRDVLQVYVLGSDERLCAMALLDNLGKGACGAALECFNLMTNRPEDEGLYL